MSENRDNIPIRFIPKPVDKSEGCYKQYPDDVKTKTIRDTLEEQLTNLYCRSMEALQYATRIERSLFPSETCRPIPGEDKKADKYRLIFPYLMCQNNIIYNLIQQASGVLEKILLRIGEEKER